MLINSLMIVVILAGGLAAQESTSDHEVTQGESHFPEAEFVASDTFRSGSYVQPLWRELNFDGHYFGGEENDLGFTGGSWNLRWRRLVLAPGLGVLFGTNEFRTMPGFSFRWEYEKSWFVTEGLIVQGLLKTARFPPGATEAAAGGSSQVRPTITDGDHVSVRIWRITAGGTWEHIQFREDEWKGGARFAFRIAPHFSAVLYILGPGSEFRGGIIFHPAKKE